MYHFCILLSFLSSELKSLSHSIVQSKFRVFILMIIVNLGAAALHHNAHMPFISVYQCNQLNLDRKTTRNFQMFSHQWFLKISIHFRSDVLLFQARLPREVGPSGTWWCSMWAGQSTKWDGTPSTSSQTAAFRNSDTPPQNVSYPRAMWNTERELWGWSVGGESEGHRNAFFSDVSCVYTIYNPHQMRCSCKYWHPASSISAEILSLCDSFCLVSREFYFDRSPRIFENILGLYRKGELHLTESVCPKARENDLQRDFL